ncbi:MAG: hypothetical protein MZU97_19405 [Bacillus subtilis]|nr:hypothetical protein [Bacillus subtilis]
MFEQIAIDHVETPRSQNRFPEKPNYGSKDRSAATDATRSTASIRVCESPDGKLNGYREMIWDVLWRKTSNLQVYASYTVRKRQPQRAVRRCPLS